MNVCELLKSMGAKFVIEYNEPYSNKNLYFAILPVEKISLPPFQREISEPHLKKLSTVIRKVGLYLDPIIVVVTKDKELWTPNGSHRLQCMRYLDKEYISAIVIPDEITASYILALNTEKAPNLKDKSLEVYNLYLELAKKEKEATEENFEFQFEEGAYITFGIAYTTVKGFSGSAYFPLIKKIDKFINKNLNTALKERNERAEKLKLLHQITLEKEKECKTRGISFQFLRYSIMARANPYKKQKKVTDNYFTGIEKIIENVKKLKPESISEGDFAPFQANE